MRSITSLIRFCLVLLACRGIASADPAKSIFDENWKPETQARPPVAGGSPRLPATQRATTMPTVGADPLPPPIAPATLRFNPPSVPRQSEILKLVKEIFEKEYLGTGASARQQLAKRLLSEADLISQNQPARFVLLQEAVEASVAAGDADLCRRALDALSGSFNYDRQPFSEDAVLKILARPSATGPILIWSAEVGELAMKQDHVEIARRILLLALPRAAKDADALPRLRAVQTRVAEYDRIKPLLAQLNTEPNDPTASLAVGKYLISQKGDWQTGLLHLAKASDLKLRDLAIRDLASPKDPEAQFDLAGLWWAQGKQDPSFRVQAEARAVFWYQAAAPGLADLKQVLARKRIEEGTTQSVPVTGASPGNSNSQITLKVMFERCLGGDPSAFDRLQVTLDRRNLQPKTTLESLRITATTTFNREGSPYLVKGTLAVEPDATLLVEPGTIILFAANAKVLVQGTLRIASDGAWTVLAGSEPGAQWSGINATGKVELRRCLLSGAAFALSVQNSRDALTASECIFEGNGETVSAGNGGRAVIRNCLLLRNDLGPYGHGDDGKVEFSQCLFLSNKRGCSANFGGRIEGTHSTFVANATAIEGAERGSGVHVSRSNIFAGTGQPLGTRGGKILADENYWGLVAPPPEARHDQSGPLSVAVNDAMPQMPACPYLTAGTIAPRPEESPSGESCGSPGSGIHSDV